MRLSILLAAAAAAERVDRDADGVPDAAPEGACCECCYGCNPCVEIKILRRVRAESSRRPPRHRRDACSMAWRCRFLAARRGQHGHVIAEKVHPTHWLIATQVRLWS